MSGILAQAGVLDGADAADTPYIDDRINFLLRLLENSSVTGVSGTDPNHELILNDQSVPPAAIDPTGSTAGQVLTSNGATSDPTFSNKYDSYDSGWFSVAKASQYTKTHNLGTRNVEWILLYASNSGGTADVQMVSGILNTASGFAGAYLVDLTTTQVTIQTAKDSIIENLDSGGNISSNVTSGYFRLILIEVSV